MKRLFLISLLLLFAIPSFAQVEKALLESNEVYYITSKNKAVMYKLSDGDFSFYLGTHTIINTDSSGKPVNGTVKKLSKPTALKVIAYARTTRAYHFDTYVVSFNDDTYIINPDQVQDNYKLEAKNEAMDYHYAQLKNSLANMKATLKELLTNKKAIIDRKLDSLKRIDAVTEMRMADSLASILINKKNSELKLEYDKWLSNQPASTKQAAKILSITNAYLKSPNSAAGCDYVFEYKNNSPKTIKYLTWRGITYNAVGDPVNCTIRHQSSFSGKDTGPVYSGDSGGGVWDCIIYNWSATELRLTSISIIYMDGSTASIKGSDATKLSTEPLREISDYEKRSIQRDYRTTISTQKSIERNKWLNRSTYAQYPYSHNEKHVSDYFFKEINLSKEISQLEETIKSFKKDNFIYE